MNCWTAEALSRYAKASIEERQRTHNLDAAYVRTRQAARSSHGIDLRRLAGSLRKVLPRIQAEQTYDAK
jgi:hypothetical protein